MPELPPQVLTELRRLLADRTTVLASDLGNFLLFASRNCEPPLALRDFGGAAAFVHEHLPEWGHDPNLPPGVRFGFRIRVGCSASTVEVPATDRRCSLWSALTNPQVAAGRNVVWSSETRDWAWFSSEKEVSPPNVVLPRLSTADYAQFVQDFVVERESTISEAAGADLRASVLSHDAAMGGRLFRAVVKHHLVKPWEAYRSRRVLDRLRAMMPAIDDAMVEEILRAAQRSRKTRLRSDPGSAPSSLSVDERLSRVGEADVKAAFEMLLPYLSNSDVGRLRVPVQTVARLLSHIQNLPKSPLS